MGTDAVPPDAQWSTDGLTDKKWVLPYASGFCFLTVRVGRNSIRPIRRPRQGDECGCPVISQGNLLGAFGPCRSRLWGVCCCTPTLTVDCMGSFCQSSDLDAPSDVPDKGTNAGARLFRRAICWGCPGPAVPDSGAYAVTPYVSGFCFLTVRVGRNSIRPIRRPRQRDECGFWVVSQGDLFGASGPYRARLWGVCNTPLP